VSGGRADHWVQRAHRPDPAHQPVRSPDGWGRQRLETSRPDPFGTPSLKPRARSRDGAGPSRGSTRPAGSNSRWLETPISPARWGIERAIRRSSKISGLPPEVRRSPYKERPPLRVARASGTAPSPLRAEVFTGVGPVGVHFTLVRATPISLQLLDVPGRRIVRREVGSRGVGRHALDRGHATPAVVAHSLAHLKHGSVRVRLQTGRRVLEHDLKLGID